MKNDESVEEFFRGVEPEAHGNTLAGRRESFAGPTSKVGGDDCLTI